MQTQHAQKPQDVTRSALKRLTLRKETLRRLTPAALRLAAGGTLRGAEPALSPHQTWQPTCALLGA